MTKQSQVGVRMGVEIDGVKLEMLPDSGSDINVFGFNHYKAFEHHAGWKPTLHPVTSNITAANGTDMDFVGYFEAEFKSATARKRYRIYVQRQANSDPPLLCEKTLLELGYIQYSPNGNFEPSTITNNSEKDTKVNATMENRHAKTILPTTDDPRQAAIDQEFPRVYTGIGKLKGFKATLYMKKGEPGFYRKAIHVPLYLAVYADRRLEEFVQQGIMEKVPDGEPVDQCCSLLVLPKPNKPDEVRLVGDFKPLNKLLKRSVIMPAPRVQDFLKKMRGMRYFFKCDLNHGYNQIELSEASKKICTVSTFKGMFRYNRLPMGIVNAQDIFDQQMTSVVSDIRNTITSRDDILGGGRTLEEMYQTYRQVLKKLSDHELTLDPKKTKVGLTSIKFHGHIFDQYGMRPDPEKVSALKDAPRPPNQKALLSFICAIQWQQSFIPRYSELALPLRELSKTQGPMKWMSEHESCYQALKDALCTRTLNNYFVPNRVTGIFCDAGKNGHTVGTRGGFGGILAQVDPATGLWIPIAWASKTMTPTEVLWSQTEIESRAVRWACDKFRPYLLGGPKFSIFTDCKSLLPLFNKGSDQCPPRIARQILALQDLDFELVFKAGRDQPADFTSRCPQECPEEEKHISDELEITVRSMSGDPVCLQRLKDATATDEELTFIKDRIAKNDWQEYPRDKRLRPYRGVLEAGELSHINGLIYKDEAIVVPTALRHIIAKLIHWKGHQGETNTKGLLKEHFWFPGFANYVTSVVSACPDCQHVTKSYRKEPMGISTTPSRPFQNIAMDFKGPMSDGWYALVIVDLYSRFPEVVFVTTTSFRAIKPHLLRFFAQHGVPESIKSDNGPPFSSHDFEQFGQQQGFKHDPVLPKHPEANGEVERLMASVKKASERAKYQKTDYKSEIVEWLRGYRATPHPVLKKSPHEIAHGWKMRTGILSQEPQRDQITEEDRRQRVVDRLNASKITHKLWRDAKRNVYPHNFRVNDQVLVDLKGNGKYEKEVYVITHIRGVAITITRRSDGQTLKRHPNNLKLYVERFEPAAEEARGTPIRKKTEGGAILEGIEDGVQINDDDRIGGPVGLANQIAELPPPNVIVQQQGQGGPHRGGQQGARGGRGQQGARGGQGRQGQQRLQFNEEVQVREFPREDARRATRSRGPAPELPNVQPAVLERSVQLRGQLDRTIANHEHEQQQLRRDELEQDAPNDEALIPDEHDQDLD
jgi:transposase InsO family protein